MSCYTFRYYFIKQVSVNISKKSFRISEIKAVFKPDPERWSPSAISGLWRRCRKLGHHHDHRISWATYMAECKWRYQSATESSLDTRLWRYMIAPTQPRDVTSFRSAVYSSYRWWRAAKWTMAVDWYDWGRKLPLWIHGSKRFLIGNWYTRLLLNVEKY